MKNKDYLFCTVCQSGVFEIKALLLASSFRLHDKTQSDLVFGVPAGKLDPITKNLAAKLDVKCIDIDTAIEGYPISNKLSLFNKTCSELQATNHIFMDSDMLWLRDFEGISGVNDFDIHLRPGGEKSTRYYKTEEDWRPIYDIFDLSSSSEKIRAFESDVMILPYFNAGFICTSKGNIFAESWLKVAKSIDAKPEIKHKRPWLDQLALPVTCKLNSLSVGLLDHRYNAPLRLGAKYDDWSVNHYSLLSSLVQQRKMIAKIVACLKQLPGITSLLKNLAEREVAQLKKNHHRQEKSLTGESEIERSKKNVIELKALYELATREKLT